MTERREITGTIYRILGPCKQNVGLLEGVIMRQFTREQRKAAGYTFYADTIVIWADDVHTFEKAPGKPTLKHQYRWKTKRYPEAIKGAQTGQRVTMTATLEPFHNGLGDYLTRATNIRLEPLPETADA